MFGEDSTALTQHMAVPSSTLVMFWSLVTPCQAQAMSARPTKCPKNRLTLMTALLPAITAHCLSGSIIVAMQAARKFADRGPLPLLAASSSAGSIPSGMLVSFSCRRDRMKSEAWSSLICARHGSSQISQEKLSLLQTCIVEVCKVLPHRTEESKQAMPCLCLHAAKA